MEGQKNRVEVFVHLVWGTYRRQEFITGQIEQLIYGAIAAKASELQCPAAAIGGTGDHVHVLVQLDPGVTLATLVAALKGISSYIVRNKHDAAWFQWQSGYGAFSVARSDVPSVKRYIADQKRHHASHAVVEDLELHDAPMDEGFDRP
jgi:REP element-mobilizing transposase RayT